MAYTWQDMARRIRTTTDRVNNIYKSIFTHTIDNNGTMVPVDSVGSEVMPVFLDTLRRQALKFSTELRSKIIETSRSLDLTKTDFKRMNKYIEADPSKKGRVKLSKRARKYLSLVVELQGDMEREVNTLLLLSPHTFCLSLNPVPESTLDEIMDHLSSVKNYGSEEGGWIKTKPMYVFNRGNHRSVVIAYASLNKPRVRIKIATRNSMDGIDDKLDIEELFCGNEFRGIVHYHVEKPYTLNALKEGQVIDPDSAALTMIEMSRSPDNEAIFLNFGDGKRRTYKDEIGANYVAGTFDFWKNHPEVIGGPIARQIIERASTNPEFLYIQKEFGSFRSRNPVRRGC